MRILHVIPSLAASTGGPAKAVMGLSRELVCRGHEVVVFTTNRNSKGDFWPWPRDGRTLDVPVNQRVERDGVRIYYFRQNWPSRYALSWAMGQALARHVEAFDLVHIHSLYLFTTAVAAHYCRKEQVPYIIRFHGSVDPFLRTGSRGKRKALYEFLIERRNIDKAAAIHFTTEEEKELVRPLGFKSAGIVVPLGVDLREFDDMPAKGSFRANHVEIGDKIIILFLSRINFKKGLDLLSRAFGQVVRQRDDVHLVIVGPDDEGYGTKVRQWLDEEGALQNTTFPGMLRGQEKLAALVDAGMFVLPSYSENFGIAVVEAMACGLPIVISNKVNIWREVAQAEAGVIVNCDAAELAKALLQLVADEETQRKLGANGRRLVRERFTWDKAAAQMSEAYELILGSKGS